MDPSHHRPLVEHARRLVTVVAQGSSHVAREVLALTQLRSREVVAGRPFDDDFMVVLQLATRTVLELWTVPRAHGCTAKVGFTYVHDVGGAPQVDRNLFALAAETFAPSTGRTPAFDDTLFQLGLAALAALEAHGRSATRVGEPIANAVRQHVAGGHFVSAVPASARGGLAAWQEKIAKEVLDAHGEGSVAAAASACELSRGHFSRAFKATTGASPKEWVTLRRIEAAREALRDPKKSLSAIATELGFADASHLSRVFKRVTGVRPTAARRGEEAR